MSLRPEDSFYDAFRWAFDVEGEPTPLQQSLIREFGLRGEEKEFFVEVATDIDSFADVIFDLFRVERGEATWRFQDPQRVYEKLVPQIETLLTDERFTDKVKLAIKRQCEEHIWPHLKDVAEQINPAISQAGLLDWLKTSKQNP